MTEKMLDLASGDELIQRIVRDFGVLGSPDAARIRITDEDEVQISVRRRTPVEGTEGYAYEHEFVYEDMNLPFANAILEAIGEDPAASFRHVDIEAYGDLPVYVELRKRPRPGVAALDFASLLAAE